jgi:AcrR family transcriptional regulator
MASDARANLVSAAMQLMLRQGYSATGIDSICDRAGVSKGAFYHHFADRSELIRAVAARVSPVREIAAALEASAGQPDRERLIALARAYHEAVGARADLIRNLAASAGRDPELLEIVMHEILSKGAPIILGYFRERIDAGAFRPIDPSLPIQALFGPAFVRVVLGPTVFDFLRSVGARPVIEDLEGYVDLLLEGLEAGEPPPTR